MRLVHLIMIILINIFLITACGMSMKNGMTRTEYSNYTQQAIDKKDYWVHIKQSYNGDTEKYNYWWLHVTGEHLVSYMWYDIPQYGKMAETIPVPQSANTRELQNYKRVDLSNGTIEITFSVMVMDWKKKQEVELKHKLTVEAWGVVEVDVDDRCCRGELEDAEKEIFIRIN